ncbi:tetratricopeptide repeat protein [Sulfitobacter sp. F26204]|uniref:tetratricopeptide repeat protein n=1 Tax=Sulfitobacter sp. F26204 TaxID=2996014 RepID=UPI00225DFDDC|nr:tetratricopeptide repeat protein [Sulfitobacter sp. F26204]MCX7560915.1 tetratricopeptide repeat protein [Sulfitobacter sp. F26204]
MINAPPKGITEHLRLGAADYCWRDGQLHDAHGQILPLRAKSLRMFAVLLEERGRILSKDRLSDLVWPETVATDESIARCIADVRKVLQDQGHRIVQTFPKQGYRLNVAAPTRKLHISGQSSRRNWVLLSIAAFIFAALGLAWVTRDYPSRTQDDPVVSTTNTRALRKAVAILPFTASTEADQFLAAGLADDLEIHLAEMSGIRVVSPPQSAAIAQTSQSLVILADTLDAKYLVLTNVRQNGDNIALSLRLIDGSDGATLWADRYEGSRKGLMTFRDQLPDALVDAMSIELNAQDRQRLAVRDTNDPLAFEELLHARRSLSLFSYEGSLVAERHLRRAIALDPEYARAYAELASAFAVRMENDWIVISSADRDKAFYFAQKALELDPTLWFVHYTLGRLHSVSPDGDTEAALLHLRKAMSLQPANDDARVYFAVVLAMSGQLDEGAAIFESVMATHPQPPFWYYLGWANLLFHQQHYEKAADAASRCLQQMPTSPYCLRTRIAVLARLGQLDDAEWAIEEYGILGQETTLEAFMKTAIERDPAMRAHLRQSYKIAGIE